VFAHSSIVYHVVHACVQVCGWLALFGFCTVTVFQQHWEDATSPERPLLALSCIVIVTVFFKTNQVQIYYATGVTVAVMNLHDNGGIHDNDGLAWL